MREYFFGVFLSLANSLSSYEIEGHYDKTLSEFMRDIAWNQTWDVDSLASHIRESDRIIVDLGVGDGRLMKRLQDCGILAEFIGIDSSEAAYERFMKRKEEYQFSGDFLKYDFMSDLIPVTNPDIIYLGSVSINCLTSIENIYKLFKNVDRSLNKNGKFVVSIYTNKSVQSFPELDDIIAAESYRTEHSLSRIIWRGLKYDPPYLFHNAFVDRRAEGLTPVFCVNKERIWREEDVIDIAEIMGWYVAYRTLSYVGDGGAQGYEVATLSFSRR